MPQQMWKHTCSESGSSHWMGAPVCSSCGGPGEYDGWHPRMYEAMAQYQTRYRLKPIGPHRRMTDELFSTVRVNCPACSGRGLRDTADGSSWQPCTACQGIGSLFTKPAEEIEALRRRVLAAYPDAAAEPVSEFFAGVVAFSGATQEVVTPSTKYPPKPAPSVFDGFPYLVIRVVPALYHITLLPGEASEGDLAGIARTQWRANRLDVCLVLGPQRALYIDAEGHDRLSATPPRGGFLIAGRLRPPTAWVDTAEVQARQRRLASFLDAHTPKSGSLFGDLTKGGREAKADDVARLAGVGPDGLPRGLERCSTCGEGRGHCLDPSPHFFCQIMAVYCRCQNDNRCAACGQRLADRKLNANYYNLHDRQIWHVPGFSGLDHQCPTVSAISVDTLPPRAR